MPFVVCRPADMQQVWGWYGTWQDSFLIL
jgi:hypothetical protein